MNWADQEGDCHDSNDAINPGVTETWYDGVDSSCHLRSDYDQDGDTHDWEAYSGTDCVDTDALINPDMPEIWYDDLDSSCHGRSDFDQDGDEQDWDAYAGTDCLDTDEHTYTGAAWAEDGAACMTDADGDGWGDDDANPTLVDVGTDCEDGDAAIHPDAIELWYDGVDQDCDEGSDYD